MNKNTKIVATIGPASCNPETLHQLRNAGIDAARINLSHGDYATHAEYIQNIRKLGKDISIILDTKGPEIRTGIIKNGSVNAKQGTELLLSIDAQRSSRKHIPITYPHIRDIPIGARILFDDGLIESEVVDNNNGGIVVKIQNSGDIGSRKKITIQGYRVDLPFLTNQDKKDILFAIENDIRLLAASFVRSAEDLMTLRTYLKSHNAEMMIFSKIEHPEAVDNFNEILAYSNGIMVARGDLGVELPLESVPGIQERIIKQCNYAGKPVIVATQMLESMRENPRPTRAEVSDVANAILQGTDAVMLSAETATGRYPLRSVEMMTSIAKQYENRAKRIIKKYRRRKDAEKRKIAQFIAKSAYYASEELHVAAILTPTESGFTARNVSRFKPKCPILAITRDRTVLQYLKIVRGVFPMMDEDDHLDLSHYDMSYHLVCKFYKLGLLKNEDRIIITSGSNLMKKRGTNLLEIYNVDDIISDQELDTNNLAKAEKTV
ncbi:MAG: pyruvate kinase [Thermodesulfobacteriota bacterium]|nr:pyruvate kinase [Thermodesulfobacteriota bacterium]